MAEQKQITFTMNGNKVTIPAGTLVIEAAKQMETEVPSFCYYKGLTLQAACRMCLVEVEKMPKLQTACTLVATEGMVVKTDTAGYDFPLRPRPQPFRGREAALS